MQIRANCKVNVGLRVKRKRDDGYHEIETLFYPVYGLYDLIDIEKEEREGQHITLTTSGIVVDCAADDNLIVRAYRRMAAMYEGVWSVRVHF